MEELTVGEVARRAGIRTSALRYYESMGLLPAPRRASGGHRRYGASILELLAIPRMAQQAGFTIAEMRLLVAGVDAQRQHQSGGNRLLKTNSKGLRPS